MRRRLVETITQDSGDLLSALVEAGLLDLAASRRARQVASATGESIVAVVHQLALADDGAVADAIARRLDLGRACLADAPIAPVAVEGVSVAFMRRRRVIPLAMDEGGVVIGVVDPRDEDGPRAVSFAARRPSDLRVMAFSEWRKAFDELYGRAEAEAEGAEGGATVDVVWAEDAARVRDQAESAPAVRLVDEMLERALEEGASDIHIEPLPDRVRIRFRIDGVLKVIAEEPAHLAAPIAARIKILADMDVADRRSPQDGRTSLAAKGRPIDVRISTVPSTYGETVALRLLRRDASLLDLATLGFSPDLVELFEHVLSLRRGLFLVTGPTGSGKTTTLYAMLQRLRGEPLKILSIEDPIEYFFPEITQTQVNEEAGLSFATALRSFLRQDPDVILVGEIRDSETARIAIQAALTGHLVLATLHTNDAAGAVSRLVDMGVDRYLVGATLAGVVAQRLTRRLCEHCRRTRPCLPSERSMLADQGFGETPQAFEPEGCAACGGSGFKARLAVGEGFLVTEAVREAIIEPTMSGLAEVLSELGFRSLFAEAAKLALAGEVTLSEVRALILA